MAFANAGGGALFLGEDDSGTVRGIPPDRIGATERWLVNVATNNCDPPIRPDVRNVCLPATGGDEKPILIVRVHRGTSSTRELWPTVGDDMIKRRRGFRFRRLECRR